MNPLLPLLQPYPFERLRLLFDGTTPNPAYKPISLGIGEPKHATPPFIQQALCDAINRSPSGLASYPATAGDPALRQAFATWLQTRYGLAVNPFTQTLPVNGSREALFALTQTTINPGDSAVTGIKPIVVCPNPFYQIYEGAALLAGALAVAHKIAAKAPVAIAATKEMIDYTRDHSVADSLAYLNALQPGVFDPEDIARAVTAQKSGQPAAFADLAPIKPAMG